MLSLSPRARRNLLHARCASCLSWNGNANHNTFSITREVESYGKRQSPHWRMLMSFICFKDGFLTECVIPFDCTVLMLNLNCVEQDEQSLCVKPCDTALIPFRLHIAWIVNDQSLQTCIYIYFAEHKKASAIFGCDYPWNDAMMDRIQSCRHINSDRVMNITTLDYKRNRLRIMNNEQALKTKLGILGDYIQLSSHAQNRVTVRASWFWSYMSYAMNTTYKMHTIASDVQVRNVSCIRNSN